MTSTEHNIRFAPLLEKVFPRLLSQACRDKNSPFYGCFDRNWWHYRIRDFASIMLQQGGYTAHEYAKLEEYSEYSEELVSLARGAALFWNERSKRRGAFEEYYPWEQGYPPLAFSTLAVGKLVLEGVIDRKEIGHGLKKAARQLSKRFEYQAGNQQVAGLAALAAIRKIDPSLVKQEIYLKQKMKTLALQSGEGWFGEYDGPDLGYLSVTLDCLWDLFDITGEREYMDSANKALDFLYQFISRRSAGAGMHNARNTDYIVPYGICRFLGDLESRHAAMARTLINVLYANLENKQHFFHAVDDRYWSHYIGHSVVRAESLLQETRKSASGKPTSSQSAGKETPGMMSSSAGTNSTDSLIPFTFQESGYIFRTIPNSDCCLLVSPRKGGILSLYKENEEVNDFGWVVIDGKKQYVNHWWSKQWTWEENDSMIIVHGHLFPHSEKTSKPFFHAALRILSFFFGGKMTGFLRKVLIFKSKSSAIGFKRTIEIVSGEVAVTDEFSKVKKNISAHRASRTSKRHVASADSWHNEDFTSADENKRTISTKRDKKSLFIRTLIRLK